MRRVGLRKGIRHTILACLALLSWSALADFEVGQTVRCKDSPEDAHYKIESLISGHGFSANVWKVRNVQTGEVRALKTFKLPPPGNPDHDLHVSDAKSQLAVYRDLIGALHWPSSNLLGYVVTDCSADQGDWKGSLLLALGTGMPHTLSLNPYLISRDLPLSDLERKIRNAGFLWEQLLTGIAELATAGYSHPDITPWNFLWVNDEALLSDLGVVTKLNTAPRFAFDWDFVFAPPEYHHNDFSHTVASNLAAAAATIYGLLFGRSPYQDAVNHLTHEDLARLENTPLDDMSRNYSEPGSLTRRLLQFKYQLNYSPSFSSVLFEALLRDQVDANLLRPYFPAGAKLTPEQEEVRRRAFDLTDQLIHALRPPYEREKAFKKDGMLVCPELWAYFMNRSMKVCEGRVVVSARHSPSTTP